MLGEVKNNNNKLFDIQLKGSGKTFFSRGGDGKCPLSAAIREYIVSEALYFLKIQSICENNVTMDYQTLRRLKMSVMSEKT